MASAASYFEKRVPEAWNRRLQEQAARGAEGAELLAKMRAADFALEIVRRREASASTCASRTARCAPRRAPTRSR